MQSFDMSVFEQKTWEFTLNDKEKTKLHLLKPNMGFLIELERFIKVKNSKQSNLERITALTEDIVLKILNNNLENKEIDIDFIKKIDFDLQILIINLYFQFVEEVMANPNS
ncbi:hypothetical protein [Cellulosilyticum sp. I15G10I2]|uniref:hypothetical protein n=1 Tax=Cellulosilyticum sp. I15G10I2 TaxID=1892843 RepID=UPI00085C1036|nr:hypothetical protein [Cellulosilyticum sp. I15G10I2]